MGRLLDKVKKNLERNNFEVFLAENTEEARKLFVEDIYPLLSVKSASYADSKTMQKTKVLDFLKSQRGIKFIETFNPHQTREERIVERRKALLVDLFVTGTNALTESGHLVNLDMVGNRVGALTFGPLQVVLFIGKNKIVPDLQEAFHRVKNIAAPINAKVHTDLKTSCQITGECHDCHSPQRICNVWTITEKAYPKGRIKIILIDEELGY